MNTKRHCNDKINDDVIDLQQEEKKLLNQLQALNQFIAESKERNLHSDLQIFLNWRAIKEHSFNEILIKIQNEKAIQYELNQPYENNLHSASSLCRILSQDSQSLSDFISQVENADAKRAEKLNQLENALKEKYEQRQLFKSLNNEKDAFQCAIDAGNLIKQIGELIWPTDSSQ